MTPEERAEQVVFACFETTAPTIETFAAAIREAIAEEREACAQIVVAHAHDALSVMDIAAAIRARQ